MDKKRLFILWCIVLFLASFCYGEAGDLELSAGLNVVTDVNVGDNVKIGLLNTSSFPAVNLYISEGDSPSGSVKEVFRLERFGDDDDGQSGIGLSQTFYLENQSGSINRVGAFIWTYPTVTGNPDSSRFALECHTGGGGLKNLMQQQDNWIGFLDTSSGFYMNIAPAVTGANRVLTIDMAGQDRQIDWTGAGSGGFLFIEAGSRLDQDYTTDATPTFANLIISDGGNLGSASDTDAIQIEVDGDIVMSQDLAVAGTLDVTGATTVAGLTVDSLTFDLTQDYKFSEIMANNLSLQSQTTSTSFNFDLATLDADGTDSMTLNLLAIGTSNAADPREVMTFGYLSAGSKFFINTSAVNGTVRTLSLETGSNTNQLILNTDNSINMSGALTVNDTLQVDGLVGFGTAPIATSLLIIDGSIAQILAVGISGTVTDNRAFPSIGTRGLFYTTLRKPASPPGAIASGNVIGCFVQPQVESEASEAQNITMTTMKGYDTDLKATVGAGASGSVTVTSAYHYFAGVASEINGGVFTTLYGFYDSGQTVGATNWGFYGLSADNYLSGDLAFGQTDKAERIGSDADSELDIAATTAIDFNIGGNNDMRLTSDSLDMQSSVITDVGGLHFNSATELTIVSGAVTVTQGHHSIDTEGDAANDDLDTINGGNAGEILLILPTNSDRNVRIRNGVGNIFLKHQVDSSHLSFSSPSGAGAATRYTGGGYYDFATTDVTLDEGSLTQTFGTANTSYAAHASIVSNVSGTVDTGTVSIVVSGTSIDDEGNRSAADSETILADITNAGANGYFETVKKWLGTITYTLTETVGDPTAYTIDFNYGFSKYEDFGNQAFTVTGVQVVGEAGASDTGFNMILFYHSAAGWTYAATGFEPGGIQLANMNTDHSTEQNLSNGEPFAWKRTDLNTDVAGNNGEGVVFRIDTTGARSVESMSGVIWVHTQPAFSYLSDTKQHLIFMKHGPNWLEL